MVLAVVVDVLALLEAEFLSAIASRALAQVVVVAAVAELLVVMVVDVLVLLEAEILSAMASRALAQVVVVAAVAELLILVVVPAQQAVAKAKDRIRSPKRRPQFIYLRRIKTNQTT